jgi:hypothetical protein
MTQAKIAERFDTTQTNVSLILLGRSHQITPTPSIASRECC